MGNSHSELSPNAPPYVPTLSQNQTIENTIHKPPVFPNIIQVGDTNITDLADVSLGVSSSLLVFPCVIGDQSTKALLDTGASVSIITYSLVQSLQLEVKSCSQSITGLAGTQLSSLGVISAPIKMGAIMFETEFIVLPDSAMKHSVILGCDLFSKYQAKINLSYSRFGGSHPWGS